MNLQNYLKDVLKELRLSTFPTQNVVINFTLFVIIFTAVMAAFLGLLDVVFGKVILDGIALLRDSQFASKFHAIKEVTEVATTTLINIATSTATNTIVK